MTKNTNNTIACFCTVSFGSVLHFVHSGAVQCMEITGICADLLPYQYSQLEPVFPFNQMMPLPFTNLLSVSQVVVISATCDDTLEDDACRMLFPPCPTEGVETVICPQTCFDLIVDCDILHFFTPLDCSRFTSNVEIGDGLCLAGMYITIPFSHRKPMTLSLFRVILYSSLHLRIVQDLYSIERLAMHD